MSQGPNVGTVLVGIFAILFGLCIALVGGGCTMVLLVTAGQLGGARDFIFYLLISLVVLAVGGFTFWLGIKLLRSGNRG
jgi:hypothetical protein